MERHVPDHFLNNDRVVKAALKSHKHNLFFRQVSQRIKNDEKMGLLALSSRQLVSSIGYDLTFQSSFIHSAINQQYHNKERQNEEYQKQIKDQIKYYLTFAPSKRNRFDWIFIWTCLC